jgi:hypothetical protein
MDAALVELIYRRASHCCEYCRLPQTLSSVPFEIDHVVSKKHHGASILENLALSCFYCNSFKGPNIAGIDLESGQLSRLYHPRSDHWDEHFKWNGALLFGLTPVGRTTIDVLGINSPDCVRLRASLIREGVFPPSRPETSL